MFRLLKIPALALAMVLPALLVTLALVEKTAGEETGLITLIDTQPAAAAASQPATQAVATATTHPTTQYSLDREIRSPDYGIVFRIPADCKIVERGLPDVIGEYVIDEKHWVIRVDRVIFPQALPITVHPDQTGVATPGVLEKYQDQLAQLPHLDLARKEVVRSNDLNVGLMFARYETTKGDKWTVQKAVVESPTQGQRVYYLLEFTAPDVDEETLAGTFDAIVHSVQVLDTRAIRQDQDLRLYNTQLLYLNWNGTAGQNRISNILIPQQWLRIIQDGNDVGYTCILEQIPDNPKTGQPGDRIKIGVGTRMAPKDGPIMNAVTWMTCTLDRRYETWTTTFDAVDEKAKTSDHYSELGISEEREKPQVVAPAPAHSDDLKDQGLQGNVRVGVSRLLTVTASRNRIPRDDFKQKTPAWYCPQAICQLLPRLLPLTSPKKYLVAIFDNGAASDGIGKIVARYLDVKSIATVTFNGKEQLATVIEDRVTLQGVVTRHYFSTEGVYLGSESKTADPAGKQHVSMVLPSDEDTLRRLWPQFGVNKPAELEPQPAAR